MSTTLREHETMEPDQEAVFDNMKGVRDALTVKRVFGDPTTIDGITVIPVARVSGGAGGGGGEGTNEDDDSGGAGFGSGFGMRAAPVGAYEVHDGNLVWKPAVDVNRLAKSGMVLAGIFAVCATIITWIRR